MTKASPGPGEEGASNVPNDLRRKVFTGALWSVGGRWGGRALGMISTMILARLLEPQDFGLVAMAAVFTSIVMAFTQLEADIGLIRLRTLVREHFDTAWTIAATLGLLAGGVLALLAPVAADYYGEPRIEGILLMVALLPVISGLENPKTALFRKNFAFNKDFNLLMVARLLSLCVSIPLAFWLRDYRALVYGLLANAVIKVLVGYAMMPYRPRFSLAKRAELMSVSAWMVVRNVGNAASAQVEQLVLGNNFGPQKTSYYYMGREIGTMFAQEIAQPLGRALLPAMSAVQHEADRMKRGLRMSLAALTIVLPVGFGVASLAPEIVHVFLGEKWLPIADLLAILATASAVSSLGAPFGPVIMVKGLMKPLALTGIVSSVVMFGLTEWLAGFAEVEYVAVARFVVQVFVVAYFMFLALRGWSGEAGGLLYIIARPLVASFVMFVGVKFGQAHFALPDLVALAVWPPAGAALFAAVLMSLWTIAGRPFGVETFVWETFGRVAKRLPR